MTHKIMVLSDSPSVRREAVQYSIELAKRMDSTLVLLVLIPFELSEKTSEGIESMLQLGSRAKETLQRYVDIIQNVGIPAEKAVRIGDPRSELVKFLAESRRFQTIVWGGKSEQVNKKAHWLSPIKDIAKCAVVVPFIKDKRGKLNSHLRQFTQQTER